MAPKIRETQEKINAIPKLWEAQAPTAVTYDGQEYKFRPTEWNIVPNASIVARYRGPESPEEGARSYLNFIIKPTKMAGNYDVHAVFVGPMGSNRTIINKIQAVDSFSEIQKMLDYDQSVAMAQRLIDAGHDDLATLLLAQDDKKDKKDKEEDPADEGEGDEPPADKSEEPPPEEDEEAPPEDDGEGKEPPPPAKEEEEDKGGRKVTVKMSYDEKSFVIFTDVSNIRMYWSGKTWVDKEDGAVKYGDPKAAQKDLKKSHTKLLKEYGDIEQDKNETVSTLVSELLDADYTELAIDLASVE